MPFFFVLVCCFGCAELTKQVAGKLAELTARILKKPSEVTSIAIDYVLPEHWVVAGRTLVEHGKSSFYFDIKVTEGTHTKDEMAQYIAEAFAAFREILGDLHD